MFSVVGGQCGTMIKLMWLFCTLAAQVSGVIAVVVYGLYGSATAKWGLSPKVAESGIFDTFWDTIGFAITGMVFFFSGVSCVNFFVRSAQVTWSSSLELLRELLRQIRSGDHQIRGDLTT